MQLQVTISDACCNLGPLCQIHAWNFFPSRILIINVWWVGGNNPRQKPLSVIFPCLEKLHVTRFQNKNTFCVEIFTLFINELIYTFLFCRWHKISRSFIINYWTVILMYFATFFIPESKIAIVLKVNNQKLLSTKFLV